MDDTLPPSHSLSATDLLIVLCALIAMAPGSVVAQDKIVQTKPMEVISDTPEYCLHLLDRVSELVRVASAPVPRDVTDLTTEGHRMCTHGHTRGGIMRLRSALMMMERADHAAR